MTLARRLEGRLGAERRRVGRNEVPLQAYASAMMHRRTRPRVPATSALDKKNINTVAVPYNGHGAALYSAAPGRRRLIDPPTAGSPVAVGGPQGGTPHGRRGSGALLSSVSA